MKTILKLSSTSVALAAFAVVALLPVTALAAGREARAAATASLRKCTQEDAQRADQEASSLSTWGDLHASYARYRQCDDGGIAEGYSDSIATLLADHWATLGELARLIHGDAHFEAFVLSHVDELMTREQGIAIKDHATRQCPKGSKPFCAKLQRRLTP